MFRPAHFLMLGTSLLSVMPSVAHAQTADTVPPASAPAAVAPTAATSPAPTADTHTHDKAAEPGAAPLTHSHPHTHEVIEVVGRAPAESASSIHFNAEDLRRRPRVQPSDVLRQIPGLVVAQHAGGGKSDQYFLRGFDADHGTDVAIFVDGVPVNLTSHGHGQGYADTHWLIPETVASVTMHKGPYAARYGDFYTAGALELKTINSVDKPKFIAQVGTQLAGPVAFDNPQYRLVTMASPEVGAGKALIAAELGYADGPFLNPQQFRRGTLLGKWQMPVGPGTLALDTNAYAARWNQSGQIPAAQVAAGRLDEFGAIDPSEGGTSSRTSVGATYTAGERDKGRWSLQAFAIDYRLRLFSNFTLYTRDEVNGDQIEQNDARTTYGVKGNYLRNHTFTVGGQRMPGTLNTGVQFRADNVAASLWHSSQRRRLADCFANANPCNATNSRIRNMAFFAEEDVNITPRLQVIAGLRADQFVWDVDDLDPETNLTADTTGGTAQRALLSPKLSAIVRPTDKLAVYLNGGYGFHSNDARGAVASNGKGSLARGIGGEVGLRFSPERRLRMALDVWYLYLQSELVWSGDNGGTEPSDKTRRYGVDLDLAFEPTSWLSFDANLAVARATLVANQGNGGALALAPRLMGGAGVALHRKADYVSLRVRGIGDRPANNDGSLTADGWVLVDLVGAKRVHRNVLLTLTLNNLFNASWREAQFADVSRVAPGAVEA
ncbi:MAG TPA: TonB-dependent receptor, partial [Kofleriaceae bacterium]|nr:TonB-dependent receptor [Kofleriaceae bacterium]